MEQLAWIYLKRLFLFIFIHSIYCFCYAQKHEADISVVMHLTEFQLLKASHEKAWQSLSWVSHLPAHGLGSNDICRLADFGPEGLDNSLVLFGQTHVGFSVCDHLNPMLNFCQLGLKFSWHWRHTHSSRCQDSYRTSLAGLIEGQVAECQAKGSLSAALMLDIGGKTRLGLRAQASRSTRVVWTWRFA